MEKENSKNIIIWILAIALVVAIGIIIWMGLSKKDKNEQVEVDEAKIEDVIKKFMYFEGRGEDIKVSDLTNEDLILFVARNTEGFYGTGISLTAAQKMTEKYLGRKVEKGQTICPEDKLPYFIYDEKTDKFIYNEDHPGHGGGFGLETKNKIRDIKVKDDEITVTVDKIFSTFIPDTGYNVLYYYDYESMIKNDEDMIAYVDATDEDIEEIFGGDEVLKSHNNNPDKIDYDKASKYEYKFKIVDDNYVLVSYKHVK